MIEAPKKALYAAVGAPVAVGKKVSEHFGSRYSDTNTRIADARAKFITDAKAEFEVWVTEGESLVERVSDRTVVDDITSRVDVDQFQEQVGKLRHQLEDMLENWRTNFLPEKDEEIAPVEKIVVKEAPAAKPAAKKPAAKKPAAKAAAKPAAKKPAAKKPAAKAAAKPAAKKPAAKKPAAKAAAKPATKKTTTKK